jgi:hypothetical protein
MSLTKWILFLFTYFGILPYLSAQVAQPVCIKVKEAKVGSLQKKQKNKNQITENETKLSKYTPLFWTGEKQGNWIEVKDVSGRSHWVRRKDVSLKLKCVTVRVAKSKLRTGPGSDYPTSEVISKGEGFLDLGSEDGWIKVKSKEGQEAWMNLDHIWRPSNKFQMKFEGEKISEGEL